MSRAIHPRVLEVELEHHREWALACWSDEEPQVLAEQLSRLVEVTFLAEYSQRPSIALGERNFEAVQLLCFDELGEDSRQAIAELGFEPVDYVSDQYVERMSAWREEAEAEGMEPPSSPAEVYKAEIRRPDSSIFDTLQKIQGQMIDQLEGEVFGETPGGPSKLMATYFRQYFNTTVTPDRKGLQSFELFLVQDAPHRLRWVPPVLFQGLCDFVGVLLQAEHNLNVQWALSTPDEVGFAPPPVFRVPSPKGGFEHIAIGEHITNWCVMPKDQDAPSLAERIDSLVEDIR